MSAFNRFCTTAHDNGFALTFTAEPGHMLVERDEQAFEVELVGNHIQPVGALSSALTQIFADLLPPLSLPSLS